MATVATTGSQRGSRSRRRRRQRAILLVALAAAFLTAAIFYLGSSGSTGPAITAAPGTSGGAVAVVSSSTLSGGSSTGGYPVAKVVVAKSYLANAAGGRNVRLSVAWTNASSSALNGKDVIGMGVYYPVTTTTASGSCPAGTLAIADSSLGGTGGVCLKQDKAVTGRNVETGSTSPYYGLIPLVASLQTGFFLPGTAPGAASACPTNGSGGTSWCLLSTDTASTSTVYVAAQVLNPAGHAPPGQQPAAGALTFFVQAKAVGFG